MTNFDGGHVTEAWSNGEIVRAVVALTGAVKELTERIDSLGSEYVRKEVYEIRDAFIDRRFADQGDELANVGADLARFRKETAEQQQSTWNRWVPPLVTGVLVSVAGLLAAVLLRAT